MAVSFTKSTFCQFLTGDCLELPWPLTPVMEQQVSFTYVLEIIPCDWHLQHPKGRNKNSWMRNCLKLTTNGNFIARNISFFVYKFQPEWSGRATLLCFTTILHKKLDVTRGRITWDTFNYFKVRRTFNLRGNGAVRAPKRILYCVSIISGCSDNFLVTLGAL